MKQLPKFLTAEMARKAVNQVFECVMWNGKSSTFTPKRQACHIVVMVPEQVTKAEDGSDLVYPNYLIRPTALFEKSFGHPQDHDDPKKSWTADYADIARCKAFKLWHGMNDGRTDILPHLMYSGDCPFWGGVKRDGIVVACSGVEPWFDRMIAGMVADMLIAGAYHAWMKSKDKKEDRDNLS